MNTPLSFGIVSLFLLNAGVASAASYVIMPSTSGEATRATTTTSATLQVTAEEGDGAITPVFLEIGGVEGDTGAKGNVEYEWKVEEGESAAGASTGGAGAGKVQMTSQESGEKGGTEDINIGVGELQEMRGGVSVAAGDIDGLTEEEKETFLATVKTHAEVESEQDLTNFAKGVLVEDEQMEHVSLNFEKIQVKYRGEGRLFGFIPIGFTEQIEIAAKGDTAGSIKIKFPWYSFLMSTDVLTSELEEEISKEGGKEWIEIESWSLGQQAQIFTTVSSVLKTRHDTAKNSIGNIR